MGETSKDDSGGRSSSDALVIEFVPRVIDASVVG